MNQCLCVSGKLYNDCCGKLHSKDQIAKTPEALMRSRYVAFAIGNIDYLLQTSSSSLLTQLTREDLEETSEMFDFVNLEIMQEDGDQVEFIAYMLLNNELHELHEVSTFIKEDEQWKYDSGVIKPSNVTKITRNDLCPCGSGKKYKKCHMS